MPRDPNTGQFDVTDLTGVEGPFDLVVDNGCLHSLMLGAREDYTRTLLRLTRPGSRCFLHCFVREPQQRRSLGGVLADRVLRGVGDVEPGEMERRFGEEFDIEDLEPLDPGAGPLGLAVTAAYLMTRNGDEP